MKYDLERASHLIVSFMRETYIDNLEQGLWAYGMCRRILAHRLYAYTASRLAQRHKLTEKDRKVLVRLSKDVARDPGPSFPHQKNRWEHHQSAQDETAAHRYWWKERHAHEYPTLITV